MIKCNNECPMKKFNGCCHFCPDRGFCEYSCSEDHNTCGEATFDEETALQEFKNTQLATLNAIASLTAHKKAIEDSIKETSVPFDMPLKPFRKVNPGRLIWWMVRFPPNSFPT